MIVIERKHPFTKCQETFEGETGLVRWRPGAWSTHWIYPDDAIPAAHGEGLCRFELHGEYKPDGYPTRLFYTQQFITPDGEKLRKSGLRIKVKHHAEKQFKRFPFDYHLDPEAEVVNT